jgi:hypothetical protein
MYHCSQSTCHIPGCSRCFLSFWDSLLPLSCLCIGFNNLCWLESLLAICCVGAKALFLCWLASLFRFSIDSMHLAWRSSSYCFWSCTFRWYSALNLGSASHRCFTTCATYPLGLGDFGRFGCLGGLGVLDLELKKPMTLEWCCLEELMKHGFSICWKGCCYILGD